MLFLIKKQCYNAEYVSMIEEHIKDRIIRFNILDNKEKPIYKFCEQHYPNIIQELQEQQKGEKYDKQIQVNYREKIQ